MGEEESTEDAVVAVVKGCDADEQSSNSDTNGDEEDDETVLHSLLTESLLTAAPEPARLAADAGAAKLTCGK